MSSTALAASEAVTRASATLPSALLAYAGCQQLCHGRSWHLLWCQLVCRRRSWHLPGCQQVCRRGLDIYKDVSDLLSTVVSGRCSSMSSRCQTVHRPSDALQQTVQQRRSSIACFLGASSDSSSSVSSSESTAAASSTNIDRTGCGEGCSSRVSSSIKSSPVCWVVLANP